MKLDSEMSSSNITIIVLITILLLCLILSTLWLIVSYFKKRGKKTQNETKKDYLDQLIAEYKEKIKSLANCNQEEIYELLKNEIKNDLKGYKASQIISIDEHLKKYKSDLSLQLLIDSMQYQAVDVTTNFSSFTIDNIDESLKPRIIGRKGRNIKKFQLVTGCDVIIEKANQITISCLNPIRKQIGVNTIQHLISSNAFDELAIENVYNKEKSLFEKSVKQVGLTILNELKIFNLDYELAYYLGLLKYRTSFSQSILMHSVECAKMASFIAKKLGLDPNIAILCGLFHDIGKAIDAEVDKDHVTAGVEIANKYNLPSVVIGSISDHHSAISTSVYSSLVKIIDTISASRPGARLVGGSNIKRANEIENLCREYSEVLDAYVIKSGRYLMVALQPSCYEPEAIALIGNEIKAKIEQSEFLSAFEININFYHTSVLNVTTKKRHN